MKTFSLSVAVIIMLAFLVIQESCAFSIDDRDPDQHMVEARDDAAAEIAADQSMVAGNNRQKRHSGPCRFCCNCCGNRDFCGVCCEWRW
ncbi:hepcidin-like [Festucalex cinctus]